MIPAFEDEQWQMTFGERAVIEGILAQLKPELALEVGTAQGGSLRRIAAHSREVHSFDRHLPPEAEEFQNVEFHPGDSHAVLRPWLEQIAAEGRRIEFALIDGDHTAEGVKADVEDVLASEALEGVMLFHDPMNPIVRRGLKGVDFSSYPTVRYVDLDFVPGHLSKYRGEFAGELWGGLGLAVVGGSGPPPAGRLFAPDGVKQDVFFSAHAVARPAAEVLGAPARVNRFLRHRARIVFDRLGVKVPRRKS